MSLLNDLLEGAGNSLAARGGAKQPMRGNQSRKGDKDHGAPGPEQKGAASNGDFESKHARGATGTHQGGKFVSKGDSGGSVSTVQEKVGITPTGTYDVNTVAAVRAYQRRHGLQVDGVVGKQTALAMHGAFREARAAAPGALDDATAKRTGIRGSGSRTRKKKRTGPAPQRVRGGALLASQDESGGGDVLGMLREDVPVWNPLEHPRNGLGRFADKIGQLTPRGQAGPTSVALPDGTRVTRDADSTFRVVRSGRIVRGIGAPEVAAHDALARSAASRHPESVGGTTPHRDLHAVLPGTFGGAEAVSYAALDHQLGVAKASPDEYVRRQVPSLRARIARISADPGTAGHVAQSVGSPVALPSAPAPVAAPRQVAQRVVPGDQIPQDFAGMRAGDYVQDRDGNVHRVTNTGLYASGGDGLRRPPGISLRHVRDAQGNPVRARARTVGRANPVFAGAVIASRSGAAPVSARVTFAASPPVPAAVVGGVASVSTALRGLDGPAILGTPITGVRASGSFVYAWGADGRVWTVHAGDVARGDIGPRSVTVRTGTGAPYTAPAMERALAKATGRPVPASAGRSSLAITDRQALPAPPVAAPVAAPVGSAVLGDALDRAAFPPAPVVGGQDEALKAKVTAIVGAVHGFSHGGYRAKVLHATTAEFTGVIVNAQGETVGEFSRHVRENAQMIYHSLFSIRPEDRASGFGTRFIDHSFAAYKSSGVKYVDVTAGLDVGGYQWAKMGFEFKDADKVAAAKAVYRHGSAVVTMAVNAEHIPKALADEFSRQMEEGMLTSPAQIAAWGRNTTWVETRGGKPVTMWLGKVLLLSNGWNGRKTL